jgi:hypothetical protein
MNGGELQQGIQNPRQGLASRERSPTRAPSYGLGGTPAGVSGLTAITRTGGAPTSGASYGGAGSAAGQSGLSRFGASVGAYQPKAPGARSYMPGAGIGIQPRRPVAPGAIGQGGGGRTGMSGGDGGGQGMSGAPGSGAGMGLGGLGMGPGGSSALGNLGLSPGSSAARGYGIAGIPGGILGGILGYGSQAAHAADQTNPGSVNAVNGMDLASDQYGLSGVGYGESGGYGVDASGGYGGGSAGSDAHGGADGPGGTSGVGGDSGSGDSK